MWFIRTNIKRISNRVEKTKKVGGKACSNRTSQKIVEKTYYTNQ